MLEKKSHLKIILLLLISLILVGIIGYSILLKTGFINSLYMTIIMISTVGYNDIPMTPEVKLFSIFIIFWGIGIVGYSFTTITVYLVEGRIRKIWRNKLMENKIAKLENHYIICGVGETAEVAIAQFQRRKLPFVAIEINEANYLALVDQNIPVILGDSTTEKSLLEAGILKARGLISCCGTDSDNIVTVLTARSLNKDIKIISRAIERTAPKKLQRAGANHTISQNEIGGRRLFAQMVRPSIISFLDVITHVGDIDLDLEDVIISPDSVLIKQNLKEARIPKKTGLTVLAIKRAGESRLSFNPNPDIPLNVGDSLLVLGMPSQINKLRQLAQDHEEER